MSWASNYDISISTHRWKTLSLYATQYDWRKNTRVYIKCVEVLVMLSTLQFVKKPKKNLAWYVYFLYDVFFYDISELLRDTREAIYIL